MIIVLILIYLLVGVICTAYIYHCDGIVEIEDLDLLAIFGIIFWPFLILALFVGYWSTKFINFLLKKFRERSKK